MFKQLPKEKREAIEYLFIDVCSYNFGLHRWHKDKRTKAPAAPKSGIPVHNISRLTWGWLYEKCGSALELRMIEMMYIYQAEYMCKDCSRVKDFASHQEIKEKPSAWHAAQGADIKCPFCWAARDEWSVQ